MLKIMFMVLMHTVITIPSQALKVFTPSPPLWILLKDKMNILFLYKMKYSFI